MLAGIARRTTWGQAARPNHRCHRVAHGQRPPRVQDREACRRDGFASAVQLAYHLVGASNPTTIRSITVVGRRLTGPELLRLREEAGASDVLLTMDNIGTVKLRRVTPSRSCREEQEPDPSPNG